MRAVTLAALGPLPGELLWDVGAGSGSIAIEWLRAEHTAGAVAIEPRADRAERIGRNALALGVPRAARRLPARAGGACAAFPPPTPSSSAAASPRPACSTPAGRRCAQAGGWSPTRSRSRASSAVAAARQEHGGALHRIEIAHAEPVGAFTGWRAQMTVVQWSVTKGA